MKRFMVIFAGFLTAAAMILTGLQPAEASWVRLDGMGLNGDSITLNETGSIQKTSTYWMVQKDTSEIGINPAQLMMFGQFAWVTTSEKGGISIKLMDTIAIYIMTESKVTPNAFTIMTDTSYGTAPLAYTNNIATPLNGGTALDTRQISAVAGYDMGSIKIGAALGYSSTWQAEEGESAGISSKDDYNRSEIFLKAGANIDLGRGMDVDSAVSVTRLSLKNTSTLTGTDDESYKSTGMPCIGLVGRLNMDMSEKIKLHSYLRWDMLDYSAKAETGDDTDKFDRTANLIVLGASDEMKVNGSANVLLGGQIEYTMAKFDCSGDVNGVADDKLTIDKTLVRVPVVFAVESQIFENITARFGANYEICNISKADATHTVAGADDTGTITNKYDTNGAASMGLSWTIGKFLLEWNLNKDILQDGPYFLSGVTSTTGLSTDFMVLYQF